MSGDSCHCRSSSSMNGIYRVRGNPLRSQATGMQHRRLHTSSLDGSGSHRDILNSYSERIDRHGLQNSCRVSQANLKRRICRDKSRLQSASVSGNSCFLLEHEKFNPYKTPQLTRREKTTFPFFSLRYYLYRSCCSQNEARLDKSRRLHKS